MVSEQGVGALKTLAAIVAFGTVFLTIYLWWSLISKFPEDKWLWTIFVTWFIAVIISSVLSEAVKRTTSSSRVNLGGSLGGKYGI